MMSEKKRYKHIPLRIVASLLIAFILFDICSVAYEDSLYFGYYGTYDYLADAWNDVDIAIVMCSGIFLISLLFIWQLFKLKWRLVAVASIVVLLVCSSIFNSYQKNILEIYEVGGWQEEVNLTAYEPFRENTLAKNLEEESSLRLYANLPRLDGATALYPLYAAFTRATYPTAEYNAYNKDSVVTCSRTSGAFNSLLDGTADMVFLMGVSEEQREQANERGLELVLTPIGREAFVFFVNIRNSISNLSVENIMGIYSGRIDNWREVGGGNREILAYQRPDASGSQIMLREIMGDTPIIEVPEVNIFDEMMGMYKAVAYKNHNNSLGYSFLYYIRDMVAENEIKFLSIDGIEPTATNIASNAYPFAHDFYAVTVIRENITTDEQMRSENTQKLIDWILSSQGQILVEKTGYVPLAQ